MSKGSSCERRDAHSRLSRPHTDLGTCGSTQATRSRLLSALTRSRLLSLVYALEVRPCSLSWAAKTHCTRRRTLAAFAGSSLGRLPAVQPRNASTPGQLQGHLVSCSGTCWVIRVHCRSQLGALTAQSARSAGLKRCLNSRPEQQAITYRGVLTLQEEGPSRKQRGGPRL